jgi:two-component system response regulator HydG
MSKANSIRVLIVDDEIDHADVMAEAVARMGHSVKQAHNIEDARRYLSEDDFDLVITDLRMDTPEDGITLLKFVKKNYPEIEVMLVTAHGDINTAMAAGKSGAYDFIQKPLDLEIIRTQVRRVVEKIQLERKNQELTKALDTRYAVGGIVGASPSMQRVAQMIATIAPTDISALILGETGAGKELVARAVHQNSKRKAGRFVALNCAGLSENMLEDELFGHVRGAFTDARSEREGRFEYADGGTLFLDEIGDMPLPMQAKLLRVLQDREIVRIGSNEPVKVDVRFISATNRDLQAAVREGTFRQDLFYRINGATIVLPPLRQRREDIPSLIQHFITRFAEKHGKAVTGIEPDARNTLVAYSWPGNVRQLENVVENMVVFSQHPRLTAADVPADIAGVVNPNAMVTVTTVDSSSKALAPITPANQTTAITSFAGMNLAELEKKAIEETLAQVHGNREMAAKILGIGERTLYRKIKEYGLKE